MFEWERESSVPLFFSLHTALGMDPAVRLAKARAEIKANKNKKEETLAKMSKEAGATLEKIVTIILDENNDYVAVKTKIEALKATLSPSVLAELEAHKKEMSEKHGFPMDE